jgi:succinate-semialdehyde dehydrogenase/glutarate-semialdehyde dehydrogenase
MNTTAPSSLPVRNPRTGQDDYTIHPPSAPALAELARSLREHQRAWAVAPPEHRLAVLREWAGRIQSDSGPVMEALARDTGRVRLAKGEIRPLRVMVEGYGNMAVQLLQPAGERPSVTPGIGVIGQPVPYPLVGVISPWNFPFLLSMLDSIPALAAGCAVLVKPSEVTPRFVEPLMASIAAVPELAKVFAFVVGDGRTGAALIEESDFICFTGSVATGRKVAEGCARQFIPCCLELGGKDPAIVLASADPDRAAEVVLRASVQATGQACQSVERVYVDKAIYEAFLEALVWRAQAVTLNDADIRRGQVGPLIFGRQAEIVAEHVADATAQGALVLSGGTVERHGGGAWIRPTVLTGVTHAMKVMREETFGPVIPVMPYERIEQAIALANDSDYGLSAAVFGDEKEALAVARQLNVGAVSINDGGLTTEVFDAEKNAFKLSGLGPSRMGHSGLLRFLRQKAILIQHGRARDVRDLEESAS